MSNLPTNAPRGGLGPRGVAAALGFVALLMIGGMVAIGLGAGPASAASAPGSQGSQNRPNVTATRTPQANPTALAHRTRVVASQTARAATREARRTQVPRPTGTRTPGTVTVCHATGSQSNPYVEITISESALPAHQAHGDIYPVPQGGCPAATPRATRTARPTNTAAPTRTATAVATATSTATQVAGRPNNGNQGNNGNNGNNANNANNANNDNQGNNGNNGNRGRP